MPPLVELGSVPMQLGLDRSRRPLSGDADGGTESTSAGWGNVGFQREVEGRFRKLRTAALGRTFPFSLQSSPASVAAWLVS
jgi:hypothetical protein